MRIKILLIDDEESVCEILKYNLEKDGYEVDYALSGEEACTMDNLSDYALFIVDIMMDRMSGFDFARWLKNDPATEAKPIIFCSALTEEDDKVMGLNMGGDDYITKPFVIGEVLARVRAVLRRSHLTAQAQVEPSEHAADLEADVRFRDLRIDRNSKMVYIGQQELPLTRTEYDLLLFFLTHRGRVYSREEIIHNVWGTDGGVTTRAIDTNLTRLRRKLGDEYGHHIFTRPGFGYGFKETD